MSLLNYIKNIFKKKPVRERDEWEINLNNLKEKYNKKEIDGIDFMVDMRGVVPFNILLNDKQLDIIYNEIYKLYDLYEDDFFSFRKKSDLISERLEYRRIQKERDEKLNKLL